MKRFAILAFLITSVAFSQQTLIKKDGSKVIFEDLYVNAAKKKLQFKANGKEEKISFSELDSAVIGKKVLKRFDIGKKHEVYYVLAKSNARTLGISSTKRVQERGGFSNVITLYEAVVIENGKIVQKLNFNARKTESETRKRYDFIRLVREQFKDCAPLQAKMELFDADEDQDKTTLLNWLDNPERVDCK